jgi:endonuclease YncB( thermonuclease family)
VSVRRLVLLPVLAVVAALLTLSAPAQAIEDRDCADFATQAEAQQFYLNHDPSDDPHGLDADDDGRACDSLPCPCGSATGGGSGTSTPPAVLRERGTVTKVVDGDTIKVRLRSGARRTVRLIGIDTPEVYGTVECGGRKASRSLKGMLPVGSGVRLVSDPTQARKDRYGRSLRYVTKVGNGRDMNRAQVAKGWARVYVYRNDPFRRVGSYRDAQRFARNHHKGVWRIC